MATMQSALVARLRAAAPVAAIVGTKIYWTTAPQGAAFPYIRMQTVSDERPDDLDDYEEGRETRVQVDCFSEDYGQARALAEAVVNATNGPLTISGVKFGRSKAEGPRDLGETVGTKFIHQLSMDLLIWHRQA